MAEIAVFGGTFDPPTVAHQAIIEACSDHPLIDEVWVMPSRCRLDKPGMSPDEVRLNMLTRFVDHEFMHPHGIQVSEFELGLPVPTETWRTVEALESAYPDNRFWYVWGADSYATMHSWEKGTELRQRLGMLLVARPGHELPPVTNRIRHLQLPEVRSVSSTMVREALAVGNAAVRHYLAPSVSEFIRQERLYGAS